MRPSDPGLVATARPLFEQRGRVVAEWASRLSHLGAGARVFPAELMQRELRLMVDLVAEMAGPMRREARELWEKGSEHYGRTAAARGLAAGEVVEELSVLREILTRDLAAGVAALRARHSMAVLLHLHRVLDRGIAVAVAGYTDTLVAELFAHDGVPSAENALETADITRQVEGLELEFRALRTPPAGGI
ncbi:MAG TPA: hypothetical protein VFI13_14255 [Gemmatimonadales bacterium]|nr:hypothetical protein [Gemmatimonadales bacterium]